MNEDQGAVVLIIIFIVGIFTFAIGYGCGTNRDFANSAVITKVTMSEGCYHYETDQFNFKSNKLYSIGDTIHVGK